MSTMAGESDKAARERIRKDQDERYVTALERELEGYERAGNKDRVAEVKKELARVRKEGRVKGRTNRKGVENTQATSPGAEEVDAANASEAGEPA
jgi:hypothetical protein